MWQWQHAGSDGTYSDIAGSTESTFTPLQEHVGRFVRVCVEFMDLFATEDGAPAPGPEGPLCSEPLQMITNVNDAPTSMNASVDAFTIATALEPYRFSAGVFPFTDEDAGATPPLPNSTLAGITIEETVTAGTLMRGADAVTDNTMVTLAELPDLIFYPQEGTEATANYTRFTFRVSDGALTSGSFTMTINIVPPGQLPASGEPAISGTAQQNETLSAGRGTVRDPNGIR